MQSSWSLSKCPRYKISIIHKPASHEVYGQGQSAFTLEVSASALPFLFDCPRLSEICPLSNHLKIFNFNLILVLCVYVCVHMCTWVHACHNLHMDLHSEDNFEESVLSIHLYIPSKDWTQNLRLAWQYFYPWKHLLGSLPLWFFIFVLRLFSGLAH